MRGPRSRATNHSLWHGLAPPSRGPTATPMRLRGGMLCPPCASCFRLGPCRIPRATPDAPEIFTFLLVPGLSMMSLASAIEPLRSLNRLAGREAYRWRLASLDGAPIEASNGIPLPAPDHARGARRRALPVRLRRPAHQAGGREALSRGAARRRRGAASGSARSRPGPICWRAPACSPATAAPSTGRTAPPSRRISPISTAPTRSTRSTATG